MKSFIFKTIIHFELNYVCELWTQFIFFLSSLSVSSQGESHNSAGKNSLQNRAGWLKRMRGSCGKAEHSALQLAFPGQRDGNRDWKIINHVLSAEQNI